jgi:colanic acid biosynthesis glycosyl transferase WcaI
MRLVVCDYSGHPFQVQMSRELARRGHSVLHLYFSDFQTPKGRLAVTLNDPAALQIEGISLGQPFKKYSLVRRRRQEIQLASRIQRWIESFQPDVVLAANLPLDTLDRICTHCVATGKPFVFWQQDIYSSAITQYMSHSFGFLGRIIGAYYRRLERRALVRSAAIIVISPDFVTSLTTDFGIALANVHTIENWAPINEIVPRCKSNEWSRRHNLDLMTVVLYTGTLGRKHDPALIVNLAQTLRHRRDTLVVIASEGPAVTWISQEAQRLALGNIRVLPFQPYEVYSELLAAADVLIALLEREAAMFSVPSKVLSYLSAGRAIVLSAPAENLSFRILTESGGGIAVIAGDTDAFTGSVQRLLDNPEARSQAAARGRQYAERHFAIGPLGDRFETILEGVVA